MRGFILKYTFELKKIKTVSQKTIRGFINAKIDLLGFNVNWIKICINLSMHKFITIRYPYVLSSSRINKPREVNKGACKNNCLFKN